MKQYSVYFEGMSIEYTGYFKSVAAVRKYLKSRYKDNGAGLTFRAVYPTVEQKIYSV
jgi:hypothetical protein